jgi:hypothetical protein
MVHIMTLPTTLASFWDTSLTMRLHLVDNVWDIIAAHPNIFEPCIKFFILRSTTFVQLFPEKYTPE